VAILKYCILKRPLPLLYEWNESRESGLNWSGHMLEEKLLVWRFNRGRTDALREIYEQHNVK
jgi:hypothetical protein